ncbi:choline transporter-like 1 [Caerostris darwini]|uniref:Choline transporter-like protein n=1 Tax=Caerostris darwini TaxID=1538125 RepID=A0AAV4N0B1_9ARAC|nr:choline transporter-like 1 [Caerostris darwini]
MSPCCGAQTEDKISKPSKSRSCTDVLCLAIFGIFWGLLIFVAAFAIVIGNPTRLAYGQDSFGNTCGMKNEELGNMTFSGMDMTHRPYLFFLNMTNLYHSLKICVKKCPDRTLWDDQDIQDFESSTGSHLCRYDIVNFLGRSALYPVIRNDTLDKYFFHVEENNGHYACPKPPVFATKSLFKRCVPLPVANFAGDIIYSVYAYLNSFDSIQQVVSDIYAVKIEILEMVALAIAVSILMVILIHKLASFVSWIIMLIACIACIGGTCVLWWTYADIKWQLDSTPFNQLLSESVHNEQTFLVYSILATIFTVILLLIVLVMRKRVNIVVLLFVEATDCIKSMPFLLLQPVFTFIALACFISFWIFVLVALATAYYPIKNRIENPLQLTSPAPLPENFTGSLAPVLLSEEEQVLNKAFTLVSFSQSSWVQYMWWYHLIALIWTSEFILGCQQMVIAGSVATWYFSKNRDNVSKPILKSMWNLIVYHLGSVALGAFLITLFKIPRIILTYMTNYMKKHQEWKCVAWCLKCCTCCLWCMEKCIRYLNHNAYTIVAIQSVGFCTAAREAFDILVSNALQVATINSVGDFILFLGKCSVAAITAFFSVLILKNNPELHFYAIPVILITIIAYFIAHCVLSVYEMVIDTLFLCCCEDILRNDGSKEKPYFGGKLVRYIKGDDGHSLQPLNKVAGDVSETE